MGVEPFSINLPEKYAAAMHLAGKSVPLASEGRGVPRTDADQGERPATNTSLPKAATNRATTSRHPTRAGVACAGWFPAEPIAHVADRRRILAADHSLAAHDKASDATAVNVVSAYPHHPVRHRRKQPQESPVDGPPPGVARVSDLGTAAPSRIPTVGSSSRLSTVSSSSPPSLTPSSQHSAAGWPGKRLIGSSLAQLAATRCDKPSFAEVTARSLVKGSSTGTGLHVISSQPLHVVVSSGALAAAGEPAVGADSDDGSPFLAHRRRRRGGGARRPRGAKVTPTAAVGCELTTSSQAGRVVPDYVPDYAADGDVRCPPDSLPHPPTPSNSEQYSTEDATEGRVVRAEVLGIARAERSMVVPAPSSAVPPSNQRRLMSEAIACGFPPSASLQSIRRLVRRCVEQPVDVLGSGPALLGCDYASFVVQLSSGRPVAVCFARSVASARRYFKDLRMETASQAAAFETAVPSGDGGVPRFVHVFLSRAVVVALVLQRLAAPKVATDGVANRLPADAQQRVRIISVAGDAEDDAVTADISSLLAARLDGHSWEQTVTQVATRDGHDNELMPADGQDVGDEQSSEARPRSPDRPPADVKQYRLAVACIVPATAAPAPHDARNKRSQMSPVRPPPAVPSVSLNTQKGSSSKVPYPSISGGLPPDLWSALISSGWTPPMQTFAAASGMARAPAVLGGTVDGGVDVTVAQPPSLMVRVGMGSHVGLAAVAPLALSTPLLSPMAPPFFPWASVGRSGPHLHPAGHGGNAAAS